MITDKRVYRTIALNIALSGFGVSCLVIPVLTVSDGAVDMMLVSIGGALVGSAVSGFWGLFRHFDVTEQLFETVEELKFSWVSFDTEELKSLRRTFHHYHVTVRSGVRAWLYTRIDFSRYIVPGALRATVDFRLDGKTVVCYQLRAVRAGNSLLLVEDAGGTKPVTHYAIFPFFSVSYATTSHGIAFHENWDHRPEWVPCLIAAAPLIDQDEEGFVPREGGAFLEQQWAKQMVATPINDVRSVANAG